MTSFSQSAGKYALHINQGPSIGLTHGEVLPLKAAPLFFHFMRDVFGLPGESCVCRAGRGRAIPREGHIRRPPIEAGRSSQSTHAIRTPTRHRKNALVEWHTAHTLTSAKISSTLYGCRAAILLYKPHPNDRRLDGVAAPKPQRRLVSFDTDLEAPRNPDGRLRTAPCVGGPMCTGVHQERRVCRLSPTLTPMPLISG